MQKEPLCSWNTDLRPHGGAHNIPKALAGG